MHHTKEKIMTAAKDLFEQNGFTATTTREIAEHAGVSEVTLFRHFETKRNLFEQTIHSCMHPYKLEAYLENEATYDLEVDLKMMAEKLLESYQQNLPLLKMIFKDKMQKTKSKIRMKDREHNERNKLLKYFTKMQQLGKLNAPPEMAMHFFMTNISGFMHIAFFVEEPEIDHEYFEWMVEKITIALRNN